MLEIQPFLTAYDPTDLPGGSVDPLGFDRGYELLADKILPGLTNVANRPRYLSAYCAALVLLDEDAEFFGTERDVREMKRERILQFERLWTLSCGLATRDDPERLPGNGIRGLRYVQAHIQRIRTGSDGDFRLLLAQARYGMIAIYGSLADKLRLASNDDHQLTEPGRKLGEAFLRETDIPAAIRGAVMKPKSVPVDVLAAWGQRAHVNAPYGVEERASLVEVLQQHPTRRRMCDHFLAQPRGADESELRWLGRMLPALEASTDRDLAEAVRAILAYERAFAALLAAFQRVVRFCQAPPFQYELARAAGDAPLARLQEAMPSVHAELDRAFCEVQSAQFQDGLDRAGDVRRFVAAAAAMKSTPDFVATVLQRHREVLAARVSGGRPKMPWVEIVDGGVAKATLASAQEIRDDVASEDAIPPHPYRTWAAERFFAAPGGEA